MHLDDVFQNKYYLLMNSSVEIFYSGPGGNGYRTAIPCESG
jgi:hypothetical protein